MIHLIPNLRYAFRGFLRNPLFTTVAILSLALGIGANTAIFTLTDQLMLRKLPIRDPDSLVMLYRAGGSNVGNNTGPRTQSLPLCRDFRQKAGPFSEVLCRREVTASVSFGDRTEPVAAEMVSGNYFTMLGVKAAAGRVLDAEDDDGGPGGHPVVVLSHDYWASHFGSDPSVVGSKMVVNNHPMTIVGVSAKGFAGLDPARAPQIRVPIPMKSAIAPGLAWFDLDDRFTFWVQVFARLKPGYTAESARVPLQVLFHQIHQQETTLPGARDWSALQRKAFLDEEIVVERAAVGYSPLRDEFRTALTVLMCMVGLVLMIACANIANLLIARGFARQKEIAVRLSTGATRGRLVGQLLAESLALSFAGGVAGVGLAFAMTRGLLALVPAGWNLLLRPEPDSRTLLFTLTLTVLTALVFGLAPALRASRPDLVATLKDDVGSITGAGGSLFLRKALVIAQVALGFLLLFGAGLFSRSLHNLNTTDAGFRDRENLVTFRLQPARNGYDAPRTVRFYEDLLERLRAVPGVKSAALASVPLLQNAESSAGLSVEGHQSQGGEDTLAFLNSFSPGYFRTMGIPLLEGRDFDQRDIKEGHPRLAIVNQAFARYFFGDQSALGRHIGWGVGPSTSLNIEIVGVVANSLHQGPREGVRRQVFFPDPGSQDVTFYVRTAVGPAATYAAVRSAVKQLDASMPVNDMKTLAIQLDETLLTDRLIALMSVGFGLLATLLATVGLYSVVAFAVARRTRELGVRMALGARPGSVIWIVMREVLVLLAIGLAIGLPAALLLGRFVSSQLYGVGGGDPWIAAVAMVLLMLASMAASVVPALRASRIDPMLALRYE